MFAHKKEKTGQNRFFLACAWDQGRTGDLSLFRGALYQLSYPSIFLILTLLAGQKKIGNCLKFFAVRNRSLATAQHMAERSKKLQQQYR